MRACVAPKPADRVHYENFCDFAVCASGRICIKGPREEAVLPWRRSRSAGDAAAVTSCCVDVTKSRLGARLGSEVSSMGRLFGLSEDVPRCMANVDVICSNIRGKCHDMTLTFAQTKTHKCHNMT